jgi:general secretion pathway protein K
MTPHFSSPRARGSALIAVLWLIAILAIACITTLRVISFDLEIASAKIHGSRARQMAERGIAVGSYKTIKRDDPLLKFMDKETGEGYEVKIQSEGSKFNINYILLKGDKNLLRTIFISWGLELDVAQGVADCIKDWADADDSTEQKGAEKKNYEKEGRINQPFNHPFLSLDELALVKGMPLVEAVKPDWRSWFTVYSGSGDGSTGGLDLNEASAEMIAAAGEVPIEKTSIVPETVRGDDGLRDTKDDKPYEDTETPLALIGIDLKNPIIAERFSVNEPTQHIESTGFAEGAKRKITVILSGKTGNLSLLERTEEIVP